MRLNSGNLIRQTRQALRLTLEESARRAGLSKGFLSQVETGKAGLGLDAAKRLAGVLGLSLEELSAAYGSQAAGSEFLPAWLARLASRYDLPPEAQDALLKVAEESVAYRSVAGGAAAVKMSEDVRWDKFYHSVKAFLPKPMSDRLLNDAKVKAVAKGLGVKVEMFFSLDDIFVAFDRHVQKLIASIGRNFEDVSGLRSGLLASLGVEVMRIDRDTDLDALKAQLARFGLLRAIGELAFFMEDESLLGGTYPVAVDNAPYRFVCLIDRHTEHKRNRSDFTLWHELAHVLCDPEIGRGSVAVVDETENCCDKPPVEWLMDWLAARLAFYPTLFRPLAEWAHAVGKGRLSLSGVESVRLRFNPEASRQMTAKALVDEWPEPMVYLEAEARHKKGDVGEKSLRVSHLHANAAAKAKGIRIGANMRIPERSVIYACYQSMKDPRASGREDELEAPMRETDENLGDWSFSDGRRLVSCPVRVSAESRSEQGQIRVYAFIIVSA